jgi:hypothetical protein
MAVGPLRETGAHGATGSSEGGLAVAETGSRDTSPGAHREIRNLPGDRKASDGTQDLERVQAEDANYPGLPDALTSLGT